MTENELKINGKSFSETISQIEEFMESDDVHGELFTVLRSARDFMENLNEEIQQYREIGTVEGYERAIKSSIENYNLYREYKAKVQEFEAIGTIDEFKALKEKSEPKKAKWIFDDFTAKFGNPYHCSNCDEEFGDTYNYCPNCGCSMYD